MIQVEIVKDSIHTEMGSPHRITTFLLDYPRFIHGEFMTHRILSKNGASSRAIPFKVQAKAILNNMASPVSWGRNRAGMSSTEMLVGWRRHTAQILWYAVGRFVVYAGYLMNLCGVHKQIINRMSEPWSHMRLVVTGTDWGNFFKLRNHLDAQPEFQRLAFLMQEAYQNSVPQTLTADQWHLPFVDSTSEKDIDVSVSMCAQTSYRKSDDSREKAARIRKRLASDPYHLSPFEHQATPIVDSTQRGVTHTDKMSRLWSGNFKGWIQYRQLVQLDNKIEIMTSNP